MRSTVDSGRARPARWNPESRKQHPLEQHDVHQLDYAVRQTTEPMPQTDTQLVAGREVSRAVRSHVPALPAASVMAEKLGRVHDAPPLRMKAKRQVDVLLVHEEAGVEHHAGTQRGLLECPYPAEHECSARCRQLGRVTRADARGLSPVAPVIPASVPLLEDTRRIDQSRWTAVLDIEAEERPGEAAHGAVLGALHPSERVFEE